MSCSVKISIIMPAYNAGKYIEKAVRSVIQQTYTNWELIVIDDESSDTTYSIAKRLADEDSRIKVFKNEKNMGVALTRNRGFDLCTGTYVALLDSDDIWFEDKLSKQMELVEKTKADIIYCSYGIVDEQGSRKCPDFIVPARTDYESSLVSSVISCSTVLLSKEIAENYRFSSDFYHEDLVLWLQLLRDGYKACGVTEVLAQYRVFAGTRASNKLKSLKNKFIVYRKYLNLPLFKTAVLLVKTAIAGLEKYRPAK